MNVEILIYCYLAICLSMIVFNCIAMLVFRRKDYEMEHGSRKLEDTIWEQIAQLRNGQEIEEAHTRYLSRKLKHLRNLMILDEAMSRILEQNREAAEEYLYQIRGIFEGLAVEYMKKERMKTAYFAYLLSRYYSDRESILIRDIMLQLMHEESLYCRENALKYIYRRGEVATVTEALRIINENNFFHHTKLLTDGLLTFTGDHEELIRKFWSELDMFQESLQIAVLNYIRFCSGNYCKSMYDVMVDENRPKEVRYAAIRYLGKYYYLPAKSRLIAYAVSVQPEWEYAAISAGSLAIYPGEDTIAALKTALKSQNWYTRTNAAKSLSELDVSYVEMIDIWNGSDRYAREMAQYYRDLRRVRELEKQDALNEQQLKAALQKAEDDAIARQVSETLSQQLEQLEAAAGKEEEQV